MNTDTDDTARKVCRACQTEHPVTEFHRDRTTRDGFKARCKACTLASRTVRTPRVRTGERLPYVSPPFKPQPPREAPGPLPRNDPWAAAPRRGPYTVHVSRPGALPTAARWAACSRECAEVVVSRVAPRVYTNVRWDSRGHGHRAIRRPPRTVVGPLDRPGACAACGAAVSPREVWRMTVLDTFAE